MQNKEQTHFSLISVYFSDNLKNEVRIDYRIRLFLLVGTYQMMPYHLNHLYLLFATCLLSYLMMDKLAFVANEDLKRLLRLPPRLEPVFNDSRIKLVKNLID